MLLARCSCVCVLCSAHLFVWCVVGAVHRACVHVCVCACVHVHVCCMCELVCRVCVCACVEFHVGSVFCTHTGASDFLKSLVFEVNLRPLVYEKLSHKFPTAEPMVELLGCKIQKHQKKNKIKLRFAWTRETDTITINFQLKNRPSRNRKNQQNQTNVTLKVLSRRLESRIKKSLLFSVLFSGDTRHLSQSMGSTMGALMGVLEMEAASEVDV